MGKRASFTHLTGQKETLTKMTEIQKVSFSKHSQWHSFHIKKIPSMRINTSNGWLITMQQAIDEENACCADDAAFEK